MPQIDLDPNEWKSEDSRDKPHYPVFGPGLVPGLYWLAGFSISVTLIALIRAYLR